MTLSQAQSLALSLMLAHNLSHWSFAFNRRKRTLGLCYYSRQRIELSAHYVLRNSEDSIRDTILHEIAHALAGPRAAHGPKWQALARQLGATPKRCDPSADMPPGRWQATCPSCQRHFHRHRRPLRRAQYSCQKCGPTRGPITFYLRLAAAPFS